MANPSRKTSNPKPKKGDGPRVVTAMTQDLTPKKGWAPGEEPNTVPRRPSEDGRDNCPRDPSRLDLGVQTSKGGLFCVLPPGTRNLLTETFHVQAKGKAIDHIHRWPFNLTLLDHTVITVGSCSRDSFYERDVCLPAAFVKLCD